MQPYNSLDAGGIKAVKRESVKSRSMLSAELSSKKKSRPGQFCR